MQRLLLVCTASALRPPQVRRRITMSAASVVVETDATDSVKITIGARTLQRTAGEPLQKALGRLAPKNKKKGKKNQDEEDDPELDAMIRAASQDLSGIKDALGDTPWPPKKKGDSLAMIILGAIVAVFIISMFAMSGPHTGNFP